MVRRIIHFTILLSLVAVPLAGQVPRRDSKERRKDESTDSVRQAREQRADSIRRRNLDERVPTREVRRGTRAQPDARPGAVNADSVRALNLPPLPLTTRPIVSDTVAAIPPRSRPRAAIMRVREQPGAPAFCGSGVGHPTFGREWCYERGFRLGEDWERARARDMLVDRSVTARGAMGEAALLELFGEDLAERVRSTRTALQLPDSITTRWVSTPAGGSILVLSAGGTVLAEVVDRNRDGRADVIWLARKR